MAKYHARRAAFGATMAIEDGASSFFRMSHPTIRNKRMARSPLSQNSCTLRAPQHHSTVGAENSIPIYRTIAGIRGILVSRTRQLNPRNPTLRPSRMPQLGLNIDHVATLREARYRGWKRGLPPEPNVVQAALLAEQAGAAQITVHLREDRRHIQEKDVRELGRDVARAPQPRDGPPPPR